MKDSTPNILKQITIVGGGSAGWMTAAALSRMLPTGDVKITLVESEQIGTIGVGEATIPDMINFNKLLGISESEFIKATNGTFKLGIEFNDWGKLGDSYFHPFGGHGVDMNGVDFHQYWLHTLAAGNTCDLEDYSICAVAAKQNKFVLPEQNPNSVLSHLRYAYHFDATAYAAYLRKYAEQRGVKRIEGKIASVQQHTDTGNIAGLTLEDGTTVGGELFFDCSGFRSLLLGDTLGVKFRDWSHWLPCDQAVAVACEKTGPAKPYTRSIAREAGWQWRIPLQHRTGNGYVHCSNFISAATASDTLLANLDGAPIAEPRLLKFTTGRRKKFWNGNCVAIGLSAGFMEPLESTSIHLINTGISKLIALLSLDGISPKQEDAFNRLTAKEYARIRDFLILHYYATSRDDSDFWNYCRTMSVPDSLTEKIELFRLNGQIFREEDELFAQTSWIAVMMGQGIMPMGYSPMADALDDPGLPAEIDGIDQSIRYRVGQMPEHRAFVDAFCKNARAA